jgi:hypothetical protein
MPFLKGVQLSAEARFFLFFFMASYQKGEIVRTSKEFCSEFSMNDRRVSEALRELEEKNILIAQRVVGRGRPRHAYHVNGEHSVVLDSWALVDRVNATELKSLAQQLSQRCYLENHKTGSFRLCLVLLVMLVQANPQGLVIGLGIQSLVQKCGLSAVSVKNAVQKLLKADLIYLVLRGGPAGFGLGRVRSIYQIDLDKVSITTTEGQSSHRYLAESDLDLNFNFIDILKWLESKVESPLLRLVAERTTEHRPSGLIPHLVVSLYDLKISMKEASRKLRQLFNMDNQLLSFYLQLFEYVGQRLWVGGARFHSFSEVENDASAYLIKIDDQELAVLRAVFSELFEGVDRNGIDRLLIENSDVKFLVFLSFACMSKIKKCQLAYPEYFRDELVSLVHSNRVNGDRVWVFSKSVK